MTDDPIRQHLKDAPRRQMREPRRLDDIRHEAVEVSGEVRQRIRESVTEYPGSATSYKKNKNRALIGLGAGVVGSLVHPLIGLPFFAYSGIKAYQAYQDYKKTNH